MKRKSLLFLLLFALIAPWAAQAQTRETLTFDFEDQTIPSTWTNDATYPWEVTSAKNHTDGGTYSIKSTNEGEHSTTSSIEATFTFVGDGTISFNCFASCESASSYWDYGIFYIDGTQMDRFLLVTDWVSKSYSVDMGSHTFKWAFTKDSSVSGGDDCFYVDDIVVDLGVVSSCPKPTLNPVLAETIEAEQASISWTENGDATNWVIEYSTSSDFANATTLTRSGIPAMIIHDLTPSTTYYVRVKANCGDGDESLWSNVVSFSTLQVATIVGSGWSDDFEGTGTWYMVNGGNNAWVIGSAVNNGGSQALYISNDGGTTNAYTTSGLNMVYATKLFTFETAQYSFDYDWEANGESSWDYLRAWLAPATTTFTANQLPDGTTAPYSYQTTTPQGWISLDGGGKLNGVSAWQSKSVTVDITAGSYLVVFMWANDGSGGSQPPAAIDNFEITKVLCSAPTTFAASDVMPRTATLGWTSDGSAWQVAYTDDNEAEPDNLTPIAVTTTTYELTGLTPETRYFAYVRTDCDGTYSAWISTNFTTGVACPAPTALTVALTSGNGSVATLSWTENGTATDWDVEYSLGATFEEFRVVNVSETPSTTLEGLTPEQTYFARVKTYCGGEDGYSSYSNIVTFTPTDALSITVNDGTNTSSYVPVYGYWADKFSKSQFIIPAADLEDMTGYVIQKMTFYASEGNVAWGAAKFEVYVAEVENTTFDDATLFDWTRMTKVRNAGALSIAGNKMVVELDAPYQYMGGNLMVGVLETTMGTYNSCTWYGVTQEDNTAIGGYETSKALATYQFLPKTTFTYMEMPNCLAYGLTIEPAAESANLAWTSENENFDIWYREIVEGTVYGFEEGIGEWTTIDADGDGFNWESHINTGTANHNIHTGDGCMTSASYDSNSSSPLTPDNYLVSPQIELGGSISFWACAQDGAWPQEHFGVAVSTTGNTDAADFTTIAEWTMTAKSVTKGAPGMASRSGNRDSGNYYEYTVDLSAYSGRGYVAIRHFNCTDWFYINVDDINIVTPDQQIPWTEATSTTNSYTIPGLTPETQYEVQVRANCGGGEYTEWMYDTFTTLPLCEAPTITGVEAGTDYITLSWESEAEAFDIALDGETIEEAYEGNSYTFENLDPGTQYLVKVRAKCGDNGDSEWVGGYATTECEAFDLPYETGFETDDYACWDYYSWDDANPIGFYYEDDTYTNVVFQFGSYYTADEYDQVLISPQLNAQGGINLEFSYQNVGGNYGYVEEFYVLYSTTTKNLDEFEILDYVSVDESEWLTYQGTLPAETKYVAIYYASEAQSYLLVDNFSFTEAAAEGQTIELSAGWNLISTYLAIEDPVEMLDMLKASLGENATEIQSEDNITEYDGEWFGDMDDIGLENEKGYFVNVITGCTVELTGTPANVGDFAINIHNGWNYIGFPSAVAIEVNTALAGFEAAEGDQIQTDYGMTEYDGEWFGDFEAFEPGYGLMYFSNSDEDKTLVFQTGDAKTRRIIAKLIELKNRTKKTGDGMTKSAPTISIKQIKK